MLSQAVVHCLLVYLWDHKVMVKTEDKQKQSSCLKLEIPLMPNNVSYIYSSNSNILVCLKSLFLFGVLSIQCTMTVSVPVTPPLRGFCQSTTLWWLQVLQLSGE